MKFQNFATESRWKKGGQHVGSWVLVWHGLLKKFRTEDGEPALALQAMA